MLISFTGVFVQQIQFNSLKKKYYFYLKNRRKQIEKKIIEENR